MPPTAQTARPELKEMLLGESAAMAAVREQVGAAIEADLPVLIEGERGTGRERVARALHEVGPRCGRRFVRLSPDESKSEADRNFERAAGGTLLVKDLARASRGSQRRLLKVVRSRTATGDGVRVVGATGVDLRRAVADELFDRELFERLGAARIALPTLRSRPGDIPPLAVRFAHDAAEELGRGRLHLVPRAVDRLLTYSWPGNVGELKDVIGRVVFQSRRSAIELGEVERELPRAEERVPLEQLSFEEMVRAKIGALLERMEGYPVEDLYEEVIGRVERPLIEMVLARARGNQVHAAKILGLSRDTLRKKIANRLPRDGTARPTK
ncbi:MAG: sigma-54-dependent Fis family transcriptional regulator [Myxococcales bacterium]|nr:sigma-54-dependent Fis family transcriptional regulator [Myxococcales bacterium]